MERVTENRVLLVNDHPDQLDMLSLLLSQSGYRVLTANNGHEGFEIARQENPDKNYNLGANSFIRKLMDFDQFLK